MNDNFSYIESLFGRLLSSQERALVESEVREVQEYVDVGEYGLALDTLIGIVIEESKQISEEVLDVVMELARLMELDEKKIHSELTRFVEGK